MKNDDSEKEGRLEAAPHNKKTFKIKVCLRCKKEYQPTINTQKYCKECGSAVVAEKSKVRCAEWRRANPERKSADDALWRKENPERARANAIRWQQANPERIRAGMVQWCLDHPDHQKIWRLDHREQTRTYNKKERFHRRGLGENYLNPSFIGCAGHHVNKSDIINIPLTLHQSVGHNVWTGKNMEQINALAYEWLAKETLCK